MRIILTISLAVLFCAGQAMAQDGVKDDGGFGSSRFSAQAPVALGGSSAIGMTHVIAVVPNATPADIEPASGEEDITPEEDTLENGKVILNTDHQAEPIVIQKDLSVR